MRRGSVTVGGFINKLVHELFYIKSWIHPKIEDFDHDWLVVKAHCCRHLVAHASTCNLKRGTILKKGCHSLSWTYVKYYILIRIKSIIILSSNWLLKIYCLFKSTISFLLVIQFLRFKYDTMWYLHFFSTRCTWNVNSREMVIFLSYWLNYKMISHTDMGPFKSQIGILHKCEFNLL